MEERSDIQILGVYPEYRIVRNLVVLSGRFFDAQDSQVTTRWALLRRKWPRLSRIAGGGYRRSSSSAVALHHYGTFREQWTPSTI